MERNSHANYPNGLRVATVEIRVDGNLKAKEKDDEGNRDAVRVGCNLLYNSIYPAVNC
jgi:hypothetical protein